MNQNIIAFDTYIYNYFIKWFDIVYPKNNNIIEKIIIIFFHFIYHNIFFNMLHINEICSLVRSK